MLTFKTGISCKLWRFFNSLLLESCFQKKTIMKEKPNIFTAKPLMEFHFISQRANKLVRFCNYPTHLASCKVIKSDVVASLNEMQYFTFLR